MKSRTWCVLMIAVLFVSTVAFASIEYDGSWTGYNGAIGDDGYTNASASANGSNPSDWEAGEGNQSVWTTEAADCHWSWDCSVYGDYYIYWWDGGTCTASAGASASVSYPGGSAGFSASVYRSADQSGGIDDDDWDADGDSGSDGASLNAYEGLDASHWAAAGASAPSAAYNFVYTSAEANAYVTMSLD